MPKINKLNLSPSSSKPIVKIHISKSVPDFHLSTIYIRHQDRILLPISAKRNYAKKLFFDLKGIKSVIFKGLRVRIHRNMHVPRSI